MPIGHLQYSLNQVKEQTKPMKKKHDCTTIALLDAGCSDKLKVSESQ